MEIYLSPFIPGLSTMTAPLHELLKKDAEFNWDASYQTTFQCVKDAIVSDTTLQYFDASCPITDHIDASQIGLGAWLLKDNKPVSFTSKALTEVEHHYVNIECKMLAVVFGAEGSGLMCMGDPSPLNLIISHRNQWLRRALQIHLPVCSTCSYTCMGVIMFFTTALVRKWPSQIHSLFKARPGPEIALDITIHHTCLSPVQKEALQLAFEMDVEMHALADIIIFGWPNDIKEVPHPLCPYWQDCESLTVEDLTCVPWGSSHHLSIRKGECPWYSAPITPRHYQNTVTCPWLCLLAWYQQGHWGSCLAM